MGSKRSVITLALLLTVLGLSLRFYRLSNQSLWTDEVSSIEVAQGQMDQLYHQSAALNNSLPTYSFILRGVLAGVRTDVEFRARSLSALAGALSIPVFMGVVYLWNRNPGRNLNQNLTRNPCGLEKPAECSVASVTLLAGLLLAVNPLHLWYSQEVRAYALMLFFGLLTVLFFELARVSPRHRWWLLYLGSGLTTIALHKTGILFPVFCLLCDAWPLGGWKRDGRGWKPLSSFLLLRSPLPRLLVHLPLIIAAFIVLALKSFPPAEEYSRRTSGLEILYTGMTFVGGYSFGPSLTELQWHGPWVALYRHLPQVALLAAVLALVALTCLRNWHQLLPGKEVFLLALGIGCVAVYGLLSGFPYNVRYALPALFGFLALLAALAKAASGRVLTRMSLAGVLLVALWADSQWFYGAAYRKGDSRAVAHWLEQNSDRVKSWTVLPGYLSRSVEWYLQDNAEVLAGSMPAKQDRTTSFPPVPDVLILGRRHHLQQPDKLIADYEAAAGAVRIVQEFTGFKLYVRRSIAKLDAWPLNSLSTSHVKDLDWPQKRSQPLGWLDAQTAESKVNMKSIRIWVALGCVFSLLAGSVTAAEKKADKLTCCQEASAQGKECRHKCCVAAHHDGKSCTKCNPNKEDLSLKKEKAKGQQ